MLFVKNITNLIIALFVVGVLLTPAAAVQQGKSYADLCFPQAGFEADLKYLGVKSSGSFKLDQIGAPYLVLEVMRTSCPHCQKEAGEMNKFYQLVRNSDLKGKVRFLAAAQSSSLEEVKKFKQVHAVPFPMLADPDSTVQTALHIQGVPTVVVLKRDGQVLRVHTGGIDSPKEALAELRKLVQ
jgi:peroxiredoxin